MSVCTMYFRYDPAHFPVLAFTGAPAQFPVQQHSVELQKYMKWSDNIASKRDEFIQANIGDGKFVGIHLRLGGDFVSGVYLSDVLETA